MKIMRSNYDKVRRCPGWSGPAWKASEEICPGGMLIDWYEYPYKVAQWRFMKCERCGTIVLPNVLKWLDYTWWQWMIERRKWK